MDTRMRRNTGNSKNTLNSRKVSDRGTANISMFERFSRNANSTIGYTRNFSNSRETSNRKPSGT
jgi:hypothetical protein